MTKAGTGIMRRIAAVITVVLGITFTGFAETVTNVRGSQRPNSNLIDIYYDLDAVDGWSYTVEVAIEGRMNEVTATTFSGDIGTGIAPGKNRHIVWEAGVDWHGNKGDVKAVVTTTIEAPKGKNGKVQLWEGGPYWADRNIGGENPWDYGLYFWWGDTMGHRPSSGDKFVFDFSKTNSAIYTFGKSVSELRSAGWVTSDGVLSPAHDAAHVKWGGEWRMPTHQELYDLCYNKCDWTWTAMNGVHGYVVRGRGAYAFNSIFLPAAGNVSEHLRGGADSKGNYWSSVPVWSWDAYELSFNVNNHETNNRGGFRGGRSIRPVQDFAILITATGSSEWFFVDTTDKPDVIVHFNANGGVGNEMEEQAFNAGEEQKLSKNTYRRDGYVFQGWAESKADADNGIVKFCDEAEIAIDVNKTLYAVWANPVLTLAAESANWSSGSITLCCTDADTSGAAHTYTLQYYDENTAEWKDVASVQDTSAGASLTDTSYSSRLGGIPPVKYRAKDENGRVSAECVTRTKHGVFVGLSRWASSAYKETLANVGGASNARKFRRLAIEQGSFDGNNITTLVNSEATTNAVSNAFADMAGKIVAGDVCVFYFSTHGGVSKNRGTAVLAFHDGLYGDTALAADIARLDAANKGIAVVGIVDACHSVAMYDNASLDFDRTEWYLANGLAQCSPNVAWITSAARVEESSYGTFNIFMLDYGWGKGWAGTSDSLTFLELAQYTKSRYDAVFSGIVFEHESYSKEVNMENSTILSRVMAGRCGSHGATIGTPAAPQGVVASQGLCNTRVGVSWNSVANAAGYVVFFRVGDGEDWTGCFWGQLGYETYERWLTAEKLENEYGHNFKGRDENSPVFFAVKAFNGAGVSDLSDIVKGWMDYKGWWGGVKEWLFECHPSIVSAAAGDVIAAAGLTAACGTKTIEKCYALGIDPEDPNDDLKIADFEMKDGKPVITLNHTEDGSGNSFLPRVKTLGKATLSDAEEWREVPEEGDQSMRFFKVEVEMP